MIRIIALFFILIFTGCSSSNNLKDVALANYLHLPPQAHGTAFKIRYGAKDYIVTAEHVCDNVPVIVVNGSLAEVLYVNKKLDFCLLDGSNVPGMKKLNYTLKKPKLREKVQVIGYPLGHISDASVSDGRIIGMDFWMIMYREGPRLMRVYKITAPTFPGNSGGPVVINNKVVGVLIAAEGGTNFGGFISIRPIIKAIKENKL